MKQMHCCPASGVVPMTSPQEGSHLLSLYIYIGNYSCIAKKEPMTYQGNHAVRGITTMPRIIKSNSSFTLNCNDESRELQCCVESSQNMNVIWKKSKYFNILFQDFTNKVLLQFLLHSLSCYSHICENYDLLSIKKVSNYGPLGIFAV